MNREPDLTLKIQQANVELRQYIFALEKEIARLQKQNAHLQAKDTSNQYRISHLEQSIADLQRKTRLHVNIGLSSQSTPPDTQSSQQKNPADG